MKIVFMGGAETTKALGHIIRHREAGDEVYLARVECGEQLVRRIIDADEVHLFHVTGENTFELGMVYFCVHARHHKLNWKIKIFGYDGDVLRAFMQGKGPENAADPKLMGIKFVPVPKMVRSNPILTDEDGAKFKSACDDAKGSCEDCAVEEEAEVI